MKQESRSSVEYRKSPEGPDGHEVAVIHPKRFRLGDWVQAASEIVDGVANDGPVIAAKGAIGHVVSEPVDGEGSVMVFFERTGLTTVCGEGDVLFLGHADAGVCHGN